MKNYFGFHLMCMMFILSSCKKEATHVADLLIAQKTYFVVEGKEIVIPIGQGSGHYDLVVDDTTKIKTSFQTLGTGEFIRVQGRYKGNTKLQVMDKVTGQSIDLPIQIVDPFLIILAGHMLEIIRVDDSEVEKEIRKELQAFKPFSVKELLVLKKNAEHDFFLFKNFEDLKAGEILESGSFDLNIYYGGPLKLQLDYRASARNALDAAIYSSERAFMTLFNFVWGNRYYGDLKASLSVDQKVYAETVVSNHEVFRLVFDLTEYFKKKYPQVRVVELFQEMTVMPENLHLEIGGDILK